MSNERLSKKRSQDAVNFEEPKEKPEMAADLKANINESIAVKDDKPISNIANSVLEQLTENLKNSGVQTPITASSLLDYLFRFLETQNELNPVLAGYFNKLVGVLMKRNSKKVLSLIKLYASITLNKLSCG